VVVQTGTFPKWLEVFARFLRLGSTSFGGPVAHLGYFRREFVERAGWLDDAAFAEIVALCSILPGPQSSQVGISLGALRAGPLGGVLAWLGFTLPSALFMAAFGAALRSAGAGASAPAHPALDGALAGLQGAAAAVVLVALAGLFRTQARSTATREIAALALLLALAAQRYAPHYQWVALLAGGALGALLPQSTAAAPANPPVLRVPRAWSLAAAALLALLLTGLPFGLRGAYATEFATFFRAGSLVFGGGHVVLPFLQTLAASRHVPVRDFFAGYGAVQAMPGPLFTFAAFLGAADRSNSSSWLGAGVATLAIFAPSFLLLAAAAPLSTLLRRFARARSILLGLNASVVGLLAAVVIDPIGRSLLHAPVAATFGLIALLALVRLNAPAWLVVLGSALAGAALRSVLHV
jgi:chromate transporter